MQLTRRHRALTVSLAAIAGGVFLIFVTRVFLLDFPKDTRTCEFSPLFGAIPFEDLRAKYHFTMGQLLEERMRLYTGETLLQCEGSSMKDVIPRGETAAQIAVSLPYFRNTSSFLYSDFITLITEFWRTYDCHLWTIEGSPDLFSRVFPPENPDQVQLFSDFLRTNDNVIERERVRARAALDRLLFLLHSSEQYLPLHASLRCLQRGSIDVRNATALISDAAQCLPVKLGQPETSLLK